MRNRNREADARAALESRLAKQGVNAVTPDFIATLLGKLGVPPSDGRDLLVGLWEQALRTLMLNDGVLDTSEDSYLGALAVNFGLTRDDVTQVCASVLEPEFVRRGEALLADNPTSPTTRDQIAGIAKDLGFSSEEAHTLLRSQAQLAFAAFVGNVLRERRISTTDAQHMVHFVDEYALTVEPETRHKIVRCMELGLLDQELLPEAQIDASVRPSVGLSETERTAFAGPTQLFKMSRVRFGPDQLKRADVGELVLLLYRYGK